MMNKYLLPPFLSRQVTEDEYNHWLSRKAQAHVRRDRHRGNETATGEEYRNAIHLAVKESSGRDSYTGEELDWSLISKYDNNESQKDGRNYKRVFAMLPTVDHVGNGKGPANFKICSWRTNDAKNDLDIPSFLALCQIVLEHHGYVVTKHAE